MKTLDPESLVDEHFGLITRLHRLQPQPGLPEDYVGVSAEVADSRVFGNWPSDRVSLGTTFGDVAGARIAAIGEAVERYCGNYVPEGLRRGTSRELVAEGHRVLGPADLSFYAPWQLHRPQFPFVAFTDDLDVAWVEGHSDSGPVWVPASWAHLNWRTGGRRREPFIHHVNYAGIATGQGLADATRRGLLEIIERDSLSLWWHLNLPSVGIDVSSVPGLAESFENSRLELHLVSLPAWFGVPVVGAVVWDPVTQIVAAGFSAKFDPAESARKATLEAIHSWVFTQGLVDADGWVFDAIDSGVLSEGLYLEHRPDRDYAEVVGPQCANVRDLGAQAQVWLDPAVQRDLLPRFTRPQETVSVKELPVGCAADMQARLAEAGHEVITCDLTTPDVALTSLRVARVCVRGLVPNAPAAFPYFGLPRWQQISGATPTPERLLLWPPPSL